MNSNGVNTYNYPKIVSQQVSDTDMNSYIEAAKKINEDSEIKLVNVQHEFGLFGGEWGDYLLTFLELLNKPVIVNFHSVLPNPDEKLMRVVQNIAKRSTEIVVMNKKAVTILRKEYNVNTPISVIPHGIPTVKFEDQTEAKKELGYEKNLIISSFGLMSKDKGYEQVIEALPKVVEKYPNLIYLIIGETHPIVRRESGEEYRNFLIKKIKELGLEKNVKFYNKYVMLSEIIQYLKATDIYISPCVNPNQITSGTLSYAMGCGRAVISTPFLHAQDAITPDKGILVNFRDSKSFEDALFKILDNPDTKKGMELNSYHQTRNMTWPNVAYSYSKLFRKHMNLPDSNIENLPKINTSHLVKMTDNFGIIQFSIQSDPQISSGYTLDDNARAMLVCTKHYERFKEYNQLNLIKTYLNFIKYVQKEDGRIYNFVDKDLKIELDQWSEDAHGRAIWALSYLIASENIPLDFKRDAEEILLKSLNVVEGMKSPRAVAFTINGLYHYNAYKPSTESYQRITSLADHLVRLFKASSSTEWKWFEQYLTYSNSKISEALLYAHLSTNNPEYLNTAMCSLKFLVRNTFENGNFVPIGQDGWYIKGKERAYYDQQPLDVADMVQTLILAHKITKNERYKKLALNAFNWFLGKNSLNQVIYNEYTGGCHDGLGKETINLNQGAESTISYLLANLSLAELNGN